MNRLQNEFLDRLYTMSDEEVNRSMKTNIRAAYVALFVSMLSAVILLVAAIIQP